MIQPSLLVRGWQPLAPARLACWLVCWSLSVAMVFTWVSVVSAEDTETDDELENEEADPKVEAEYQQLINYALDEYERGSWEESAALFRRAHELVPSARTLRGLGLATYEARRYAESIRHLRAALADSRRPLTAKQREEVQATVERARLFVGGLEVDRSPEGAQVLINGRVAQPEPDGQFIVDAGWVDIEVSAPGHTPRSRRLRIGGGEEQRVVLHLSPIEPESVATAGSPRSSVTTSGLPPGGYGQAANRDQGESGTLGTLKWVAGGASLVALGVGGTMLAMQKVQAPAYERECTEGDPTMAPPDCEERHTYLSSTLWTGSIVGLSVGGALTALTVVLFALDASAEPEEPALVCGGMGSLGVSCQARF